VCLRLQQRGTVSSSIFVLRPVLAESRYLHSQGSPDRTLYEDCSLLFLRLTKNQEVEQHLP
jgi:hypothetical protein